MHFCKANIAIGGDDRNVAARAEYSPVSWPEIEILRLVHGEQSVTEVQPFAEVRQSAREERDRLALIYGPELCAHAWGGRSSPTEMEAPGVKLRAGVSWLNPLTNEEEVTGGGEAPESSEDDDVPFDEPKVPLAKRK